MILNTILNIKDIDGNGYYDVNDFLKMKNNEILEMNNGKKFDIVLMNPPYGGNLHLKFIEKAIKISDTLINISPGGFLFEIGTYSTNEKKTKNIIKHLYKYERLDHKTSNNAFNTGNGIMSNLHIGIYKNNYNDGKVDFDETVYNIYKKIRYTLKRNLRNNFIRCNKLSNNGLRLFRYHYNPNDNTVNNIICTVGRAKEGIDFKTENEKINFIKSISTWVYKFMNKCGDLNPAHLPWLENYTEEWTENKLYKLFNITEEEKIKIEQYIKDIK